MYFQEVQCWSDNIVDVASCRVSHQPVSSSPTLRRGSGLCCSPERYRPLSGAGRGSDNSDYQNRNTQVVTIITVLQKQLSSDYTAQNNLGEMILLVVNIKKMWYVVEELEFLPHKLPCVGLTRNQWKMARRRFLFNRSTLAIIVAELSSNWVGDDWV